MTLLSAAIISASDAELSIYIPTGNAIPRHDINTCSHQQANQQHGQSVEGTTENSLESHTTPIYCSMIILLMLPTVHKKLPCYILQRPFVSFPVSPVKKELSYSLDSFFCGPSSLLSSML
jgi:hypothetical protein